MSNQSDHVVIIGAGHAGGALCGYLRQYGFQGQITVIGAESTPPYQRPPLSKAWLKDTADIDTLLLKGPAWYDAGNATLLLDRNVVSVDSTARKVMLSAGEAVSYDHLVFATGASARRLPVEGAEYQGVTYLRNLVDAAKIKLRLQSARRLAIVGGGYIGLEVAATARHFGVDVVVLEREERLLSRSASAQIAHYLQDFHSSQGVAFTFGADVAAIEGRGGNVSGVRLASGGVVDCDTVLVGIGAVPNSSIAERLGITTDGGILVDSEGRTSADQIWAIGDVTRRPLAHFPGRYRLESVPSALEQAKRVACTIAGRELPAHELPWFWSDQFDAKLQIAGMPATSDTTVLRGNPKQGKFTVFHLSEGRLCAAECVNSPGEFLAAKKAIVANAFPDAGLLADAGSKLSDVLAGKVSEVAAAAT